MHRIHDVAPCMVTPWPMAVCRIKEAREQKKQFSQAQIIEWYAVSHLETSRSSASFVFAHVPVVRISKGPSHKAWFSAYQTMVVCMHRLNTGQF